MLVATLCLRDDQINYFLAQVNGIVLVDLTCTGRPRWAWSRKYK